MVTRRKKKTTKRRNPSSVKKTGNYIVKKSRKDGYGVLDISYVGPWGGEDHELLYWLKGEYGDHFFRQAWNSIRGDHDVDAVITGYRDSYASER